MNMQFQCIRMGVKALKWPFKAVTKLAAVKSECMIFSLSDDS